VSGFRLGRLGFDAGQFAAASSVGPFSPFNSSSDSPLKATGLRPNTVHQMNVENSATVMIEYAGGVRGVVDVRWNRDFFVTFSVAGSIYR
jgi:hypothetical protein